MNCAGCIIMDNIIQKKMLAKNTQDVELVIKLQNDGLTLSDQAKNVINNSTHLKEMGLIIFLDRYAIKSKRDSFEVGDLVVAVSKDHPKYPKKDLGIIVKIEGNVL